MFYRIKATDPFSLDANVPFIATFFYSLNTRFAVLPDLAVLAIFGMRNEAKVLNPIILPVSIDVINLHVFWDKVALERPCKPVGKVFMPVNPY